MGEYGRGPKAVNFNIPHTTVGAENSILTLNFINFFESTKSFIILVLIMCGSHVSYHNLHRLGT